ncbi:mCG148336, partial [Mus musculus]
MFLKYSKYHTIIARCEHRTVRLFVRSFVRSFVHSFIHSVSQSFFLIYLFTIYLFLRQGFSGTCSVEQVWPGTGNLPASVSQMLRLKACATT